MVSGPGAQDLFMLIMGKTLSMFMVGFPLSPITSIKLTLFQKQMDSAVNDSYDSIALFLCIHIVHRYKVLMLKRNVPALEK
jgi:hypothetical protein